MHHNRQIIEVLILGLQNLHPRKLNPQNLPPYFLPYLALYFVLSLLQDPINFLDQYWNLTLELARFGSLFSLLSIYNPELFATSM